MVRLTLTDTSHILTQLDILHALFGWIKKLVTDNGPNLSSIAFNNYCLRRAIDHQTSAPKHPEGNGIAENSIKKCKAALR